MEKILSEAKNLRFKSATEPEIIISDMTIEMVKGINLDDECILASYLYYPYIKTSVYIPPSEKESKFFDETKRRSEEEKKRKLDAERLLFKENLTNIFGEGVVNILHALKKLLEVGYKNEQEEAENIRKMLLAIVKDVRVMLIKICSVLAELKYLKNELSKIKERDNKKTDQDNEKTDQDNEKTDNKLSVQDKELIKKAEQKSKQILDIFAPLAARLGLSAIKSELEDISFEILNPKEYENIYNEVERRYIEREKTVNNLKEDIKTYMKELNLSGEVMGRKKHIYSIYKKLKEKNSDIDKIYDLVAVRAILPSIADCYALLGKIHGSHLPLQHRFKDYISIPKSNGYQSLHTTIIFEKVPVEIQIRTQEMHRRAEFGVAAHWLYKEKKTKMESLDEKLGWIREIMENQDNASPQDLINSLKIDIYDGEIFVQTPKGKVLHMPENSTPIDFAYLIHTDIGNKCVGAKINGKMQPITKPLMNGDIVEIITNANAKGPSRDWLKIVKTAQAKSKILAFFRKEMKDENIKNGKIMFEQAIKNAGYSISKLIEKEYIQTLLEKYNFSTIEELYSSIGYGAYSAKVVSGKLIHIYQSHVKKEQEKRQVNQIEQAYSYNQIDGGSKINIQGVNNLMIRFANCCCPIEGDEIIGFISRGYGIIIHRKQCPNLSYFDPNRLIEVEWK